MGLDNMGLHLHIRMPDESPEILNHVDWCDLVITTRKDYSAAPAPPRILGIRHCGCQ